MILLRPLLKIFLEMLYMAALYFAFGQLISMHKPLIIGEYFAWIGVVATISLIVALRDKLIVRNAIERLQEQ